MDADSAPPFDHAPRAVDADQTATAEAVLEQETVTTTADSGYSSGEYLLACEEANINTFVPPNRTIDNQHD